MQEKSPLQGYTQESSTADSASGTPPKNPENAGQPAEHLRKS